MENSIDHLSELFEGLKFKDAVYTEKNNTCTMNFLYNPDCFKPTEENKARILDEVKKLVGDFVKFSLNFVSCPLDKRAIANYTYTTIINNFPSISRNFNFDDISVDINSLNVVIHLKISQSSYDYAVSLNREKMVADKLKESFLADFSVVFEKKENSEEREKSYIEDNMELNYSIRQAQDKNFYSLTNIVNIIGKNDYTLASDFSTINTPMENVAICGEVVNVFRSHYIRKTKRNGVETEIEHAYYRINLKLNQKFLSVVIFPKQADESKGDLIEPNMKVCCFGSFRLRNDRFGFTATSIARCEYSREEKKQAYKQVNENYHTVFPSKYVDYEQAGLFDEEEKTFPGTFVVFDLETTGLEANKDEIIEIGACKIENGRITEIFSTFVNPNKKLHNEIVQLTGITDAMLKDAPTINYVLPDFYKFCYGSTLVAHNISFDIGFIYSAAKKLSYNFDNPLMDTLEMAHKKLPGLKNYKLGTIVDKLNIILNNAHRAVNDATATAKVFIKLM